MGPDRVCLCGYMGVGKTEVGKRLASLLGYAFLDLDAVVSVSENQKISELFYERGESYFRACELREARKLLDRRQMVLALGGGALTTAELLRLVRERAYLVYLQASPETLSDRIKKGNRPLLAEVESFDAVGGKILTPSEDVASVRLVFANGARANVTASRASLSPMRRFRMFSPSSYVSLDFTKNEGLLVHKGPEFDAKLRELYEIDPSQAPDIASLLPSGLIEISELELGGGERPLQAELASFLASVRDGTEPEVGGADGRRALELAERIRAEIVAQPW